MAYAVGMAHHHSGFDSALFWLWHSPVAVKGLLGFSVFGFVKKWWAERQRRRLLEESQCWPEQRANVLTAQVLGAPSSGNRRDTSVFIGSLTYSYMADEIEIGEYRHHFEREDVADAWARAMRSTKQVRVRVDPQDKTRSVWIEAEADHALLAAGEEVKADDLSAAPLTGWRELVRVCTLAAAALGGVFALYLHLCIVLSLLTHRPVGPSENLKLIGVTHIAAIVCIGCASYVTRKRFPLRGASARIFMADDPSRNTLLWLSGYATLAFLAIFLWLSFGQESQSDPVLYALSAAWLPVYASAYVACVRAGADEELGAGLVRR
jgi:hypothetical protein